MFVFPLNSAKKEFALVLFLTVVSVLVARPPETVSQAELVLSAFKQGYPDKITETGYDRIAADWYMIVCGKKFYWAEGRILPEELRHEPKKWRAYVDYTYPFEIPNPENFTSQDVKRINSATSNESRSTLPPYNQEFYSTMYGGKSRKNIESNIKTISFLGKNVTIHKDLIEKLKLAESDIYKAAETDQETKFFLQNLQSAEGYNWREIADTQSRSYHSWGLAIDVLPKGWGQKNLYWFWISSWNKEWMLIPINRRWTPSKKVVEIFESHGFIWGGKWVMWDNMHFEYRPELILLRNWSTPQ